LEPINFSKARVFAQKPLKEFNVKESTVGSGEQIDRIVNEKAKPPVHTMHAGRAPFLNVFTPSHLQEKRPYFWVNGSNSYYN
jgi:hypothetical protein